MYRFSYDEILEDASDECRGRERLAFDRAIDLLNAARSSGAKSRAGVEAVMFIRQLWGILIKDLISPENGLPEALRAQLVSIGIWIIKETDQISRGESENFSALIDINTMIRDGLR